MPKKKTNTLDSLREKVAVKLQRLVRVKAALESEDGYIECWSCGEYGHWKEMQGGHWIERTKKSTKCVEENIHPQCAGCNGFGWKYHTWKKDRYCRKMREFYGDEFVDELIFMSNQPIKQYRGELEDLLKEYSEQVKELEAKL